MSHPLTQAMSGRWLALAAVLAIVALGLALTATSLGAARTETALRHQITELVGQNRQAAAIWGAKLASCETAGNSGRGRVTNVSLSPAERARELASKSPAGFDVCARMESADQAVMETLKK